MTDDLTRTLVRLALVAAVLVALMALTPWLIKQVAVDSCLDRGGRYHEDNGSCER
jgi:hypothetical protein